MFVRQKTINGKTRFYLVENYREDRKVRQHVLAYLGESNTVEGAIVATENEINFLNRINGVRYEHDERTRRPKATFLLRFDEGRYFWAKPVEVNQKRIYKLEARLDALKAYSNA